MKFDDYFLVNVTTKKEEMKINDFEKVINNPNI